MSGPRTKHKDNQFPSIKIALREWAVSLSVFNPKVLDVYGGKGMMYRRIWHKYDYSHSNGDAIEWLKLNPLNFDIYDIDPYSSPFEAIKEVGAKEIKDFVITCTDGMLRRQAGMRGNLTHFLSNEMGWPKRDNTLFANIFYNYPSFLRSILKKICPSHTIANLAVKYGKGSSCATCYFAVLLKCK